MPIARDHIADWTRSAGLSRFLGQVSVGGVGYFVGVIAILHVLRPDVSPMAAVTSEYAVGPYGFLMTSAYFMFAIALIALGVGLTRVLPRPAATPGIALLFVAAMGTTVAGLVPVDVGAPRPVTAQGWVHRIAAIAAFGSMTLGPLLLSRVFRREPGWRHVAWLARLTGALGLLGLIAMQAVLLERGLGGAAQRMVLLLIVTWILASDFRIMAMDRS